MTEPPDSYVHRTPQGGWRITGSRVSLDSIVHDYWEGLSPEGIQEDFPTLSLEQIHGALAFYLKNRNDIDQYLASEEERSEVNRKERERASAPLLDRLRASRKAAGKEGPA